MQGDVEEVTLNRMATAKVADMRRIFDRFTEMQDKATKDHDEQAIHRVQKTIELWENMLISQHDHDESVHTRVDGMQNECASFAHELAGLLAGIARMQGWSDENEGSPALALVKSPLVSFNTNSASGDDDDNEEAEGESFELFETPRAKIGGENWNTRADEDDWDDSDDEMPITEFSRRSANSKTTPILQFSQRSAGGGKKSAAKRQGAPHELFSLDLPEGAGSLVEGCKSVCSKLEKSLNAEILAVPSSTISAGFTTRATVGMMLVGTKLDNMVVGAPAFNSQKLRKGDQLLKVDDTDVEGEDLHDLLIGSDVPGSFVRITVMRNNSEVFEVTLMRAATSAIADNVRMFELFTALKDQALLDKNQFTCSLLDEAIELWTAMLLSQADSSNTVQHNVLDMQNRSQQLCEQLKVLLTNLQVRGCAPDPSAAFRIGVDRYKETSRHVPPDHDNVSGSAQWVHAQRPSVTPSKVTLNDDMFIEMLEEGAGGTSPNSQSVAPSLEGSDANAASAETKSSRRNFFGW